MTRKEKELKVLELFDLKVGDKILIKKAKYFYIKNKILKVIEDYDHTEWCIGLDDGSEMPLSLDILIKEDWKKVEPLKDKKCKEIDNCADCPLRKFVCVSYIEGVTEHTLGEVYNAIKQDLDKAKQAIYGEE